MRGTIGAGSLKRGGRRGLRGAGLAAILTLLASCAGPPTAPSTVPAGDHAPQFGQQSVPVPPRLNFAPPTALGRTRFLAFGDSVTYGTLSTSDGRFLFDMLIGTVLAQ
jgi:hypothetical protein